MDGERATTSRRRFLGTAAGVTGAAIGAVALGGGKAAAAITPQNGAGAEPAISRAFTAGYFLLEFDGTKTGFLKAVEGGNIRADVVEFQDGTGAHFKHIGNIKFDDVAIDIDLSQSRTVYDWIDAALQRQHIRKSGAIVAADFNYEAKQRREFYQALISEVTFPALDAADKSAAALTVKFAVEQTLTKSDSGKVQAPGSKQKAWTLQNFRLELDGLDCTKVVKVDGFTVKVQIVETQPGGDRLPPVKQPGKIEFPNLSVTFASPSAATWTSWFDDFCIKGNNGQDKEKSGKLVFLAPNNVDVLAEVELFGVGIFRLEDGLFDPVNEPAALMRAHLYVERMRFKYIGGATPQPTPTPNSG